MTHPCKRALIVDDSKSARAFLSRILEHYHIEVDTADSAEHAIEYLGERHPDVIFMDHLMPGMDGFQAVQAIKGNPRTATIPIMMYTSEEGDLYLGRARALGAAGVLPKQIRPADVSKLLYELRLVPERRSQDPTAFRPIAVESPAASQDAGESGLTPVPIAKMLTESALREQFAELRRTLVAGLDSHSERIAADLRSALQNAREALAPPPAERPRRPWGWILLACLALLGVLGSSVLLWNEAQLRRQMQQRLSDLEQSLALSLTAQRRLETELDVAQQAAAAALPLWRNPLTQELSEQERFELREP
jgi:CheY-like chemotaxis protein